MSAWKELGIDMRRPGGKPAQVTAWIMKRLHVVLRNLDLFIITTGIY